VLKFPRATQEPADLRERMTMDSSAELSFLERMETVAMTQEVIEARFGKEGQDVIGATMSAATFASVLPGGGGGATDVAVRSVTNKELAESREAFMESGYLEVEDDGTELWRISVRVAAFQNVDYGSFAAELKEAIEPVLVAHQFRTRVLRAIEERPEDKGSAASVVFWQPQSEGNSPSVASTSPPEIFMRALGQSLEHVNLRVAGVLRADPDKADGRTLDKLKSMGQLVLLGSFTDAQVAKFAEQGVPVVDARWHVVQETMASGVGAPEQKPDRLSAVYTGVVPIVYKAQRALLESLIQSTLFSFLTITPLMMFVTRSIPAGMVVMLPNVLPVLVVFGGMGWLGVSVDIGAMMSASIALGVAVDDTIHYLAWFRDDLKRLGDRRLAIEASYRKCATPTLQAALISGLGLSVFALSTFTPTQRFGWLMLTILVAGVVAELIMLPALLAGPLGRVFRVKQPELPLQTVPFNRPHAMAPQASYRAEEVAKRAAGR
jgi:hypothetical protein